MVGGSKPRISSMADRLLYFFSLTGGGEYPLPASILGGVPDIAYAVPDLEAVATLTLTSSTGEEGELEIWHERGHDGAVGV